MDGTRITVALDDQSGGFEVSPDRVRLGDLVRFSADVKEFLQGDGKELDTRNLEVQVIQGSFALQTFPLVDAPKLFSDLRLLHDSELMGVIDIKRKAVMERWQKAARNIRGLTYKISAPFLDRPLVVSAQSDFRADDADHWVVVERYVRGEIQEAGGSKRPNAHVRLPSGNVLIVETDKELLRTDKINRLYKTAMLRIKAEYNVKTRELRNARLLGFVEYATDVDEADIARMTRHGAEAWKDVPDASAWVDELRGGQH
jgi:hypothetical protein